MKRLFKLRNGYATIDKDGGLFVSVPVDPTAAYICPYCGSTQAVLEQREGELHECVHCFRCHEVIGWSHQLKKPCAKCGKVTKAWEVRLDGKVEATCMCCGRFEAYPD